MRLKNQYAMKGTSVTEKILRSLLEPQDGELFELVLGDHKSYSANEMRNPFVISRYRPSEFPRTIGNTVG